MNDELKPVTKLTKASQIVIQLQSAPTPTSEIILATSERYHLVAGRNKQRGFWLALLDRKTKERYSIAGYTGRAIKPSVTIDYLIAQAQGYISAIISRTPAVEDLPKRIGPSHHVVRSDAVRNGDHDHVPTTEDTHWVHNFDEFRAVGGVIHFNADQTEVILTLPAGVKFGIRFMEPVIDPA